MRLSRTACPQLSAPNSATSAGLPGIHQALAATRHLLEMYRRQLPDEKTRRTLQRLDRRLLAVARTWSIASSRKMRKDWPVKRHKMRHRVAYGEDGIPVGWF